MMNAEEWRKRIKLRGVTMAVSGEGMWNGLGNPHNQPEFQKMTRGRVEDLLRVKQVHGTGAEGDAGQHPVPDQFVDGVCGEQGAASGGDGEVSG